MSKQQIESALEKYKIIHPYLEEETTLSKIAKQHSLSLKTLKRWVKAYRDKGLSGLNRKTRSNQGVRSSLTKELEELIEALALRKTPITLAAIHRKIVEVAEEKKLKAPSYRVVRDVVQSIDPALVKLAQEGTKAYDQTYELVFRREASMPNELWQADHTLLDIVLVDEKGQSKKPWLTTIIDDYSRAICGYYLSFENPCTVNVSLSLKQAIWRKSNPKWQVCGIPGTLYSDNGKDFKSKHIEQVAADLKIQLKHSTPDKPRGKGRIERFFQTVDQLLLMDLQGYSLNTPSSVGTLSLEEFASLFEKFIVEEYHQRTHSGTGMTPLERWTGDGFLPQLPESLEQLDVLLLTVARSRKVHRDGIHFQNFLYTEPTLAAYVGEEVTIRYDPRDLAEIRIYYKSSFLCRAVCQELADQTITLKEIIKARQRRKRELRETIDKRKSLLDTILETPQERTYQTNKPENESENKTKAPRHNLKLYEND